MDIHLVDGTYELFRHHYGVPSHLDPRGVEVAAARGVVGSVLSMLEQGATHLGVATDQVIESFRNDLWPGYKTSAGVPPELLAQFPLLEDALAALGVAVWPMVELEADDAIATGARRFADSPSVSRVIICSPDKDLAQCVVGGRVILWDRRRRIEYDAAGVRAKWGVEPVSIPDYLALVGDSSDGFPGLPGWGAKTAAAVLSRYVSLEAIPRRASEWDVAVRGGPALAATLAERWDEVLLYRTLARLRLDAPIAERDPDELRWDGVPRATFQDFCDEIGLVDQRTRPHRWRAG